jgi:hypothetical protein
MYTSDYSSAIIARGFTIGIHLISNESTYEIVEIPFSKGCEL